MNEIIQHITKKDQKIALSSIQTLIKNEESVEEKKQKTIRLKVNDSNDEIIIPIKAFELLKSILTQMAKGNSIALLLADSEISTQQAADILNVSRPHLVKLLEEGKIPFKKVGTHRRLKLNDLLAYQAEVKKERRKHLDTLAKEAQELNLGYE